MTLRAPLPRVLVGALLGALTACSPRDDGRVALGDDEGALDSIAARGDSIASLAMRGFTAADSAAAMAQGAQRVRDELSERLRDTSERAPAPVVAAPPVAETAAGQVVVGRPPVVSPPNVDDPPPVSVGRAPRVDAGADRSRALGDTVRGIVEVVGTAPMTRVTVRSIDGATVTLNGMAASDLGRIAGTDVVVRGVRTSPVEFVAADFNVRRVDGVEAIDGMLVGAADGLMLQLRDGTRRRVGAAPAGLRALVGTRVWIAGSLERPTSFGRITRGP